MVEIIWSGSNTRKWGDKLKTITVKIGFDEGRYFIESNSEMVPSHSGKWFFDDYKKLMQEVHLCYDRAYPQKKVYLGNDFDYDERQKLFDALRNFNDKLTGKKKESFGEMLTKDLTPEGKLEGLTGEVQVIKKEEEEEYLFEYLSSEMNMINVVERFHTKQPFYYDNAKIWWLWNHKKHCWVMVDETDLLVMINGNVKRPNTKSKTKMELLEAFKQVGRKNKPLPIPKTWVQFGDQIYDIADGSILYASPKFFVTNPIKYRVGDSEDTPVMDEIFESWVGKEYVPLLYEILAYACVPDYFLARIFVLLGSGSNGKSCYLNIIRKFLGEYNCASTELEDLINFRFEKSRLYKKLVCLMGETNFDTIKRTSVIKKLSGNDSIGYEFKGKDLIHDSNYAKLIIATNSLPTSADKTVGFYRRWVIVDFPNQFDEKEDILKRIPPEEYHNLARKCVFLLTKILVDREFTAEGTVEERRKRFESKSNYLEAFIEETTKKNEFDGYVTVAMFYKRFTDWCKDNRHRAMSEHGVGALMKKLGYEQERKDLDFMRDDGKRAQGRVWLGLEWR